MARFSGKNERKRSIWPLVLCCIPGAAAIGAYGLLRTRPAAVRSIVTGFAFPVRQWLTSLSAHTDVSLMEIYYAVLILGAAVFFIGCIVRLRRTSYPWRVLLCRVLTVAIVVLTLEGWYVWLWGFDYYGDGLTEKSALTGVPPTAEALYALTEEFAENANALAEEIPRNSDGRCAVDPREMLQKSVDVYTPLYGEFPFLELDYAAPKAMAFSEVMSITGFTGVYFPFTGEANVNIRAPSSLTALTAAHELAHQSGIFSEEEANFLAVAACTASSDSEICYAGYFGGLIYLMNALYDADHDGWTELHDRLSPQVRSDWQEDADYWAARESVIEDVSEAAYDTYLKSYGQEEGIQSYGACVDLMVEYFG